MGTPEEEAAKAAAAAKSTVDDKAAKAAASGSYTVKNEQKGPRGFASEADPEVMLDPGKSGVFDLTDKEAARLKSFGFKVTAKK